MITEFPGARAILAVRRLPQPDQLCGPFAAAAALAAVLDDDRPGLLDIAAVSGSMIWPHDLPQTRPPRTAFDRSGWDALPAAPDVESAGTTATGLALGLEAVTGGRVAVVPATGPHWPGIGPLLRTLTATKLRVAVVANVRTGPISESSWDVGHFVVLWGVSDDGRVAVADSYRQLGAPGLPPGCRLVDLDALVAALSAEPGRGLLLLTLAADRGPVTDLVRSTGLRVELW